MTMGNGDVKRRRRAVVVGAGPVGCLAALALARAGWEVELYEGRDSQVLSSTNGSLRSINLAISARGIAALEVVHPEAAKRLLQNAIPMQGRMVHDRYGKQSSQLYTRDGQCINSIDRGLLNKGLLQDVLQDRNIRLFFQHKLTLADFDNRTLVFNDANSGQEIHVQFDFCIGADGSYSNVRRQLMRVVRMDFEQSYIPHEYLELRLPPRQNVDGKVDFALDPNHLHIWPRHSFMLIALPNKDKSFTCTLFAPSVDFTALADPPSALRWMYTHFPDAVALIGERNVLDVFRNNPRSSLVAIKANPYHYRDRAVILGDAAHSMVPFFGQGLNCGLEDVRVLDVIMRNEGVEATSPSGIGSQQDYVDERLERALHLYTESRHDDLLAICDLAMDNYVEMRHSVATPSYLFFRALDNLFSIVTSRWQTIPFSAGPLLSRVPFPSSSPGGWIPLYTMVTFRPDISYRTAKRKAERQSWILYSLLWTGSLAIVLGLSLVSLKWGAKPSRGKLTNMS